MSTNNELLELTSTIQVFNDIIYFVDQAKTNLTSLNRFKYGDTTGVIFCLKSLCDEIKKLISTSFDKILKFKEEEVYENVELIRKEIDELVDKTNETKNKHDAYIIEVENLRKLNENKSVVENQLKTCNIYLDQVKILVQDSILCCKSIKITSDTSDQYELSTPSKLAYVIMFVNLLFKTEEDTLELEPDIKAAEETFVKENGFDLQNIEDYKNLTKKETEKKIDEIKTTNFENYSSLIIVYDSHGSNDGKLIPSDDEPIAITKFWEACDQNPSLFNKPIIIIIEACRGGHPDRLSVTTKTNAFHRFHPEKHNFLIVFATSDDCLANIDYDYTTNKPIGSHFLLKFFEILKAKPEWDILAHMTVTTKKVLDEIVPKYTEDETDGTKTHYNQTVNFVSLFPRQFRFRGDQIHDWEDVEEYASAGKVVIFFNEKYRLRADDERKITHAINEARFEVKKEQGFREWSDVQTLITISGGTVSDHDIHANILPPLQRSYSYRNNPYLKGRPKVFLNLGNCSSKATTGERTDVKATGSLPIIVSENSDNLSYCDRAEGWCDTICDVIRKSPGNSFGLVRLLTEAMRRPTALASKNPPHIQSSLRLKLVIPDREKKM